MRKENLKLIIIVIVALALRLVNISQSFWLDEAAQVIESARPLWQQFDLVADFHPPLYHLILHFWLYLGRSEFWIRMLSIIFATGSIVFIYNIGRILLDKKTAIIAAFFLAISPYHIWYSQEARPYMLFLFFSMVTTYFMLSKKWLWYSFALTFSLYTHYFTFFLFCSHIIYVLFFQRRNLRSFILGSASAFLVFSLWMGEFSRQLNTGTNGLFAGWQNVVSVTPYKTVGLTFAKFIFGRGTIENNFIYAFVILPAFLLFIFSLIRIWRERSGKILITLFFVPFAVSEFISIFIPINAPQRLIFLLPIFFLILSSGIQKLSRNLQLIAIFIVMMTSIGGIYQYYNDPNVRREQWREAVSFTESSGNSKQAALFIFPGPFAPFTWYARGKIDAWGIAPKFILTDDDLATFSMKLAAKNRIYLYQYMTGLTDPQGKTQKFLTLSGFTQTDIRNFPGVGFIYIYDR